MARPKREPRERIAFSAFAATVAEVREVAAAEGLPLEDTARLLMKKGLMAVRHGEGLFDGLIGGCACCEAEPAPKRTPPFRLIRGGEEEK